MRLNKKQKTSEYETVCTNDWYAVCQDNGILTGKQDLKYLNSYKLIRFMIMQCMKDDKEFKKYELSMSELAEALNTSKQNLYTYIDDMTDDIIVHPLYFRNTVNGETEFIKIPWVSICAYRNKKLEIKLNDELKPFLLGLDKNYGQYIFSEIKPMKSIYTLRLFEYIHGKAQVNKIHRKGFHVKITVKELQEAMNCEGMDIYKFNQQIKRSVNELNEVWFMRNISCTKIRNGKNVVAYDFFIISILDKMRLERAKEKQENN